jgi:hypothetical protein
MQTHAQADSAINTLTHLPKKYISEIEKKTDKYYSRITNKTEKTLAKLAKWEQKIKTVLEKANPAAAEKLFGNNQLTFATLLEKYKEGTAITENYRRQYNEYTDKLQTSINYLTAKKDELNTKIIQPVADAKKKIDKLKEQEDNTEAVQQFIKERKKQLTEQAIQYIGNSKYLQKIAKENYYYVETLKNYKELFHDKQKAEQAAINILKKIPAFQKFMRDNSQLASLFRLPTNGNGNVQAQNLAGLQTRASVNALIQNQVAAGGPNAAQQIRDNIQQAQAELNKLKDKIIKAGGSNSDAELPNFKPNTEKSKLFKQRIFYTGDFQFTKPNRLMPVTADIGVGIGYKLNGKSVIGIGASYKLGMGTIQRISFSHQGISARSYLDWKAPFGSPKGGMLANIYISGGYELNHNAQFKKITQLNSFNEWQQSGLLGISKKIPVKTKWVKGTKLSLLYDFLARQHVPVSQPVLVRVGYNF